jgi:hypothetical protein
VVIGLALPAYQYVLVPVVLCTVCNMFHIYSLMSAAERGIKIMLMNKLREFTFHSLWYFPGGR